MGSRLVFVGALAGAIGCGALVGSPAPSTASADGGTADGGAEAAADFCAGATFCDTFERTDTQGKWDHAGTASDGSLAIATERAHSGSRSLAMTLATTDDSTAAMTKALPASSRVKMTFALYMSAPAGRGFNIGLIDYQSGNISRGVYLFVNDDQLEIHEQEIGPSGQNYGNTLTSTPLPTGRWAVITFDLVTSATPGRLTVTLDDRTLLGDQPLTSSYANGELTAVIGSEYSTPGQTVTVVDFDDVRVDATP